MTIQYVEIRPIRPQRTSFEDLNLLKATKVANFCRHIYVFLNKQSYLRGDFLQSRVFFGVNDQNLATRS